MQYLYLCGFLAIAGAWIGFVLRSLLQGSHDIESILIHVIGLLIPLLATGAMLSIFLEP